MMIVNIMVDIGGELERRRAVARSRKEGDGGGGTDVNE